MEQPIARNEIIGITDAGLALRIDGREEVASWSAIRAVSAVMALENRDSDSRIRAFVIGIEVAFDERLFIVGECEPLWECLASNLADVLPGMPPLEAWMSELAARGKAILYERVAGVQ